MTGSGARPPTGWPAHLSVRHPRHGLGRVVADVGDTVVVRFDGQRLEQVPAEELTPASSLDVALREGTTGPEADVLARARALAIGSVNGQWGVFSRSLVELLPHQLWVCRKVSESWPIRWLVADDVGLGKTIECGLVLMPLIATGKVRRLLILAPARLVPQWQARLKQMFDIRVQTYVAAADREGGFFWDSAAMVVGSFHTLRGKKRGIRERLLEADPWDMVVVDEAHHFGAEKKTGRTLAYELLEQMEERKRIQSLLLFTGTPHRGKDFQFYSLMRLVRPDLFDPEGDADRNLANLRQAMIRNNKASVTNLRGRPIFTSVKTEKRDYAYSEPETHFYRTLSQFIAEGRAYAASFSGRAHTARQLLLTVIQKLAASSVAAVRNALVKRCNMLEAKAVEDQNDQPDGQPTAALTNVSEPSDEAAEAEENLPGSLPKVDLVSDEIRWLQELIRLSHGVPPETKIERLTSMIAEEFQDEPVLLFTEYKATQALVVNALRQRFGLGTCAFINGDERLEGVIGRSGQPESWSQSRELAARDFNAGTVRFLVSTEAGGEGIDLQERCAVMIHVDLPWNPMRLHQRVGRLSRYGQKRDVRVRILRNPETVESRIWELLEKKLTRIQQAFSQTMEDPEDITQLVIGMSENNVYNEIFSQVPDWEGEKLSSWFDDKTATLGGTEIIEAARTLAGNIARFDFQGMGKELPQVDLPDLEEFVKGAVQRHGRRIRKEEGGIAFLSPRAWKERNYAILDRYDALVFERRSRDADAMAHVLGIGHAVVDTALAEALDLEVRIAEIASLRDPMLLMSVEDQVTGTGPQANRLIFGVREVQGKFVVLRDWELLRELNRHGTHARDGERTTTATVEAEYARLAEDWSERFDADHFGQAAGMKRPVAWAEMLLLPSSGSSREPAGE